MSARFWAVPVAAAVVAAWLLVTALRAQSNESPILLPPPPANFLDEFPPSYRAIPPFEVSKSFNDPENSLVAARQRGYSSIVPDANAANFDVPLLSPHSLLPPATNISASHPPGPADSKEVDAASRFVLDRAIREDNAFITAPNRCLECFDDVFPNGTVWLRHGNKEISAVTNLIDEVYKQCVAPEVGAAKTYWHRVRPLASGDTRIQYLGQAAVHLGSMSSSGQYDIYKDFASFPSGHSTTGMVDALVLADIAPPNYRVALLARGVAFGDDRVLLGAHYPSDVAAGRVLGEGIYESLAADPNYRRALVQARIQFKAALDKQPKAP